MASERERLEAAGWQVYADESGTLSAAHSCTRWGKCSIRVAIAIQEGLEFAEMWGRKQERERCAAIVETWESLTTDRTPLLDAIAAAIRAGDTNDQEGASGPATSGIVKPAPSDDEGDLHRGYEDEERWAYDNPADFHDA